MHPFSQARLRLLLVVFLASLLSAANVQADGKIGEHVNDLKAHIDQYSEEVNWLVEKVEAMVGTYASDGAEAAEPAKLMEYWEEVKFHSAIETTYVPVYANIWQGLYGVRDAIEQGETVEAVAAQQQALERALWQALGAVKLAAEQQQDKPRAATDNPEVGNVATLEDIGRELDRVVAKYAENAFEEARLLVHATYANRFEGVEGALIEQDADLVEDLEKDFNVTLPQALDTDSSVDEIKAIVASMQEKLDRARSLLAEAEQERKDVF